MEKNEKTSQPSMRKSFLDEKHKIKKKNPNSNINTSTGNQNANLNATNIYQTIQNVNSSNRIDSVLSSMKLLESKNKKKKDNISHLTAMNNENSFKDISHISRRENFVINNIDNSMFNDYGESYMKQVKYVVPSRSSSPNSNENRELSEFYKNKIENAQWNEEILLPDKKLKMNILIITKPIKIKGQIGSCIEITEGPILINIAENAENDSVKISQLRIIFNDNDLFNERSSQNKSTSILFKLYQGSLLELEDCDVIHQLAPNDQSIVLSGVNDRSRKTKSVAFLLHPCRKTNIETPLTSVLTITNSRISNFYQTLRSRENCILNIEKSCISQNYGKSIAVLNPLIIKISETTFEKNAYDAIHIKFIKEDLIEANRKFYFNQNIIEFNMGSAICLEGIKGHQFNLSIMMSNNIFRYNNSDGVIVWDLSFVSFEVTGNTFVRNKGNGLNIQKVGPNETSSSDAVKLRSNNFTKNYGFGLLVNDSQVDVSSNSFVANRASGLILCNLVLNNPKTGLKVINSDSVTGVLSSEGSGSMSNSNKTTKLSNNNFQENGESGLKLINYNFQVRADQNIFKENCEHGIFIDLDYRNNSSTNTGTWPSSQSEKIKNFKSSESSQAIQSANLILSKCIIEKNLKSGISMCNCFIFSEESYIVDNISYAIYTPRKEFQYCFKESKDKKNIINGNLGGEWGEINANSKTPCNISCTSEASKKNKKLQIENEVDKVNPNKMNSMNEISIVIRDAQKDKNSSDSDEDENDNHKKRHKKNKGDKDEGCLFH